MYIVFPTSSRPGRKGRLRRLPSYVCFVCFGVCFFCEYIDSQEIVENQDNRGTGAESPHISWIPERFGARLGFECIANASWSALLALVGLLSASQVGGLAKGRKTSGINFSGYELFEHPLW